MAPPKRNASQHLSTQSSKRAITTQSSQRLNSTQSSQQLGSTQDSDSYEDFLHDVNVCVTKVLAESFTLHPIKKSDILHNVSARGAKAARLIVKVKKKLLDVYGLTLEEYDGKFILINPKNKILDEFTTAKYATPAEVFLAIVLTLIVHNDDEILLDDLKSFFSTLSVDLEGNDSYFGNMKKLLNELEQQMYLEKSVETVSLSPPIVKYRWGFRSKKEVSKKDLRPIVAKMYRLPPDQLLTPLLRMFTDTEE